MKNFKTKITLLTFLLTSLIVQKSFGQEKENAGSKFGLGVSLFNLAESVYDSDYDFGPSNSIYLTFNLGSHFRLEPTVGFVLSGEFKDYSLGIGAFWKKPISKFNILYGLRLGLNSSSTKIIAPTIGGEYYLIKNFSVGSEVQLRGLLNDGNWTMFTNSSVLIRFYL